MGRDEDQGKEGIFGQSLPGTGGDAVPSEGDDLDVEGHRRRFDGPEDDKQDTEAHLYPGGPWTEGEFTRRGPGENPHGDR